MHPRFHHNVGQAPNRAAAGRLWFVPALVCTALQLHCNASGGGGFADAAPADAAPADAAPADAAHADAAPADAAPADAAHADAAPTEAPRSTMPAATGPTGDVGIIVLRPGAALSVIGFGRPLAVPDLWPLLSVQGRCAVRRAERPRMLQPMQYAGVVTLRGSSGAEYVATPEPPSMHSYTGSLPQELGERVEVQATGGAVPSFRASFTIPQRLVVTSPTIPEPTTGRPVVVRRAEDLALTWEPPQAGRDDRVTVRIHQSRFSVREGFLEETLILCDYPPAAGRGVVPAATFAALMMPEPRDLPPTIQVSLRNLQVLRLGEHAVAVSGEVTTAQGFVEFQ